MLHIVSETRIASLDSSAIPERRRLRRKLTFWRSFGLIAVVAGAVGATYALGGFSLDEPSRLSNHIARISIEGVVTDDDDLLERLEEIRDSNSVQALIVDIDTPGGTTYGGERIYKTLREIAEDKPVVAQVRTLAASAGYMIASATDHIVAGEASIVGSIGVIFQYGNVAELLDRLGVSVDAVKSTPLKAEPSPFGPTSPEAVEMIQALVDDSYDWFVDIVVERRDFSRGEALQLADGSIFTGRQALANGLIDEIGADTEVLAYLETRGVAHTLPIREWEEESSSPFFLGEAVARVIESQLPLSEQLRALTDGKLFLDGLVSVWQVDPQ